MSKATKIWLIVAAALVLLGVIVLGGAFALVKGDIFKLTTHKYETNIYEITEAFDSISINTDTADIVFVSTDEENCKIVCYEEEKMKHSKSWVKGFFRKERLCDPFCVRTGRRYAGPVSLPG